MSFKIKKRIVLINLIPLVNRCFRPFLQSTSVLMLFHILPSTPILLMFFLIFGLFVRSVSGVSNMRSVDRNSIITFQTYNYLKVLLICLSLRPNLGRKWNITFIVNISSLLYYTLLNWPSV